MVPKPNLTSLKPPAAMIAHLTPLIPPAALIAPKFPPKISAVTNMLAIERAKQKVMELKAQKLAHHQQFLPKTIAQTATKGTGRVAHANTTIVAQVVCIVELLTMFNISFDS